jgi:drug/metabolite transporter (DMT)-like permease
MRGTTASERSTDLVLLAVAIGAVSFSGPLVREAAAPALALAFWRNGLSSAVLVPITAVRHREEARRTTHRERKIVVLAGLFLAAHFATWIPSLSYTSVASSVALVATQPIWAALIAAGRGHPVPRATWVGVLVAFAGTLVLAGVDLSVSGRSLFGDGLALAGGFLAAAYVSAGADARKTLSTTVYTTGCYSIAAVCLLIACVLASRDLAGYDSTTWLCIIAITIGPQFLGHSLVNRTLRTLDATLVSVAILFEVVGATLIAWWWFGESPSAAAYPAAALIAVGVVVVLRSDREPVGAVD